MEYRTWTASAVLSLWFSDLYPDSSELIPNSLLTSSPALRSSRSRSMAASLLSPGRLVPAQVLPTTLWISLVLAEVNRF